MSPTLDEYVPRLRETTRDLVHSDISESGEREAWYAVAQDTRRKHLSGARYRVAQVLCCDTPEARLVAGV